MKKIAIYGAGSLGTILGAYLRQAGLDVDLISHNKAHVEALNQEGATVVGTVNMKIPVHALLPEEMTETYDLIFLLTKQLNNKEVVKNLVQSLKPNGILCTMQNGLPELELTKVIGEERVMGCTISWGATLLSPGIAELTLEEKNLSFALGRMNGMLDDQLNKVKRILEQMGPVEVSNNFKGIRWSRLIINAAFSGMSTVLGCTIGEAVDHKLARKYILQIIKECIEVARAQGVNIAPIHGKNIVRLLYFRNPIKKYIAYQIIPLIIKKHRLIKSSMLQDVEKGKPCEIDSINGAVSQYGKKYNVPTPYCDKVVEIVHRIEKGTLRPSFDNLALFRNLY
jgi:2-dehydropantoate 2-reductase